MSSSSSESSFVVCSSAIALVGLKRSACSSSKFCLMKVNLFVVSTLSLKIGIRIQLKSDAYRFWIFVWIAPRSDQFRSVAALVIGKIWSALKTVARIVSEKKPLQKVAEFNSPVSKACQAHECFSKIPLRDLNCAISIST